MWINELELIIIVVALKIWRERIQNRNVLAYCNNAVSVEVINTGWAKNRLTQACLREICFITAKQNAVLKLVHLSSECNRISDCLSRWSNPQKREQFASLTQDYDVTFIDVDEQLFRFSHEW